MQTQTTDAAKVQTQPVGMNMGMDYGQMMQLSTNGEIVKAFTTMIFSNTTKFDIKTVLILIRNMAILLVVKMILEDSKNFLDKFSFTNVTTFKYIYQCVRYSTLEYDFRRVGDKWLDNDSKSISLATLSPMLENKSIFITQPGTYYFEYRTYIIKIIVTLKKISFLIPKIEFVKQYLESEIINRHREIIYGNKTTMFKVIIVNRTINLEPIQSAYAFETTNYKKLKKVISTHFLMDSLLKFTTIPLCFNFDGPPGTGKTSFGNYIASSDIFDRIIISNMVQATDFTFEDIINLINKKITASTKEKSSNEPEVILYIIDEIDKWLESRISAQIEKLRNEARTKKQISGTGTSTEPTMIESCEKLTEEEEDAKRMFWRNEFFDKLYRLVEGQLICDNRKYVIIFNTNDFEKMFSNIDPRYDALKDRITKYKFSKIGKRNIIEYFKSFKNKLEDYSKEIKIDGQTNLSVLNNVQIDNFITFDSLLYDDIPETIEITYRKLQELFRNKNYSVQDTIEFLKTNYAEYNLSNGYSDNTNDIDSDEDTQVINV